jgi:tripartite-type tricarboxylate transporter receptor subunit TctC
MQSSLKATLATAIAMGVAAAPLPVHAQTSQQFPSKPIRFIVPAVAGAANDITTRAIAQKLSEAWGTQVIADNRGGAAGAVALDLTAQAAPDGHTILMLTASQTVNTAVNPKPAYDLTKDFATISQATSLFYMIYHSPAIQVNSVKDLIAHAKANPGKLNYGSTGAGSLQHFAWEMFGRMAGVTLVHVPYKGGAQAIAATLAGDIQIGFGTLISLRPHMSSGRLRVLAITAKKRSPAAPDLPTVAEAGVPGYEVDQWYGAVTAAKVSPAIIRKLNAGIVGALKSPDVAQRLTMEGSTPVGSSPEEFSAHIKSEIVKWGKLAKDAGLALH